MTVIVAEHTPLVEALANQGIRPAKFREAHPMHIRCPKCDGGREREDSLVLTIDPGSQGAVWHCHRGSCGWTDNMIIGQRRVVPFSTISRPVRKPPPVPEAEQQRSRGLYEFFAKRGISEDTVDAFGCYLTKHWFGKQGEHEAGIYPAIVFPYRFGGEVVNRKYRSAHKQLAQETDPQHTLYNIDAVTDPGHVVICEGETDCLAIYESGWKQVVTLKDGAPAKARAEDDPKRDLDRRYEALNTHADLLKDIEKIYLAGDMDEPGKILREELARRLGRHRCWLVTWPNGCKDAGDVLREQGVDVVNECIREAAPYPIEDVQDVDGRTLDDYLERPSPRILKTGITAVDQAFSLPGEGRLIIVTGSPNAGKSQFVTAVMMYMIKEEDRRFLVFSPEMQPWEEYAIICSQILVGKPARRSKQWMDGDPLMSRTERVQVGNWMKGRVRFLSSDSQDTAPTLDWILERATESVLRLGITDLVIDPWNEIEHQRSGQTETDYTGRSLQKLRAFAGRHGCNVWIVAHPTKLRAPTPGEEIPPPGPYDISGSANWANKADIGITVHTPESTTSIILWKARFSRWGRKNSVAEVHFDQASGRYVSPPSVQIKHGPDAWGVMG